MVVLDGDDERRAPSPEPLVAHGPLDDSDAEGEMVPLEARLRRIQDEGLVTIRR